MPSTIIQLTEQEQTALRLFLENHSECAIEIKLTNTGIGCAIELISSCGVVENITDYEAW